jgi:V8-like Glu-specific endopeptidase
MRTAALLLASMLPAVPVLADEGLWTFEHFPAEVVSRAYGVEISPAWLAHVRLATARLTNCTAAFVSGAGLLITNHHCLESCLGELSSKENGLLERGFLAADQKQERRCATQSAEVLVGTEDVTAVLHSAVAALGVEAANEARKRLMTNLEQGCEQASAKARTGRLTCQVVTLYGGGQYMLYRYKRYEDVRLVFAPESDIAAFGGDADNFQYPRWSLDFALLRAYENGLPAITPEHLRMNFAGPHANEVVFVSGHPGSTSRNATLAQLEVERDVVLPTTLLRYSELHGGYLEFARRSPANEQLIEGPLRYLENGIKVRRKLLDALHEEALLSHRREEDAALEEHSSAATKDSWRQISSAVSRERTLYLPYTFIEGGAGFNSILFRDARWLVRAADERAKPNPQRLREFTDAALPRIEQQLDARVPIYGEVESMTLSFSLRRMREWLGPDDRLMHWLFANEGPEQLAIRLVAESKLDDAAVRRSLWMGGKAAVEASRDPLIELVRALDPDARRLRKNYEDTVEAPIAAATQQIAALRFATYGNQLYPDATFTLRLNWGTVAGWTENGIVIEPFTQLGRAFERANGVSPFKIPDSWMRVKDQLDLHTPFCISTNNDIVGGNSGSPLINAQGEVVGLMFDGNIHSISGDYWFDPAKNRAVAVHPAIIRLALDRVYGAHSLLAELEAP